MKFIFSGGGTLGPVTPLISLAEELKRRGHHDFLWIGTYDGVERRMVEDFGMRFIAIPSGRWRRFFSLRNITDPFRVVAGCIRAYVILRRERPDAILTAGGFVSVPVAYAAHRLKIPFLVHQQDIEWGLANKLMVPFATWITANFPISLRNAPPKVRKRVVVTGNPVRSLIRDGYDEEPKRELLLHKFHLEEGVPVILVLGGGTGALHLNELMAGAAKTLTNDFQIMHVTGKGKAVPVEGLAHAERYHHYEFFTTEIRDALHLADIVVSRAGLGTITELALLEKPTILVPIHNSHQEENADYLAKEGAVVRLYEESMDAAGLSRAVADFANNHERQKSMAARLRKIANPDAAVEIIDLILKKSSRGKK